MRKNTLLLIAGLSAGMPAVGQVCNDRIATSTPTADFVDNGDGTVTHLKTGLMWKKCAEGQTKAKGSNRCLGMYGVYKWQQSLQRAETVNAKGYAGFTDWRVPNYSELISIVEEKCYQSSTNEKIFPDTASARHWSATPSVNSAYSAWFVSFNNGFGNFGSKVHDSATVRLVRQASRIKNTITGVPIKFGVLNDTGINRCSDNLRFDLSCPVKSFPRQDAQLGRDAIKKAGKLKKIGGGRGSFDFTRLNRGACVRDNVTGLIWESKTDKGGLHDGDNTYSLYNPDFTTNGGFAGRPNLGSCTGSKCDTYAYVNAVNAQALCGFTDWRLPTRKELLSLVDRGISYPGPTIDSNYFPNTRKTWFWSSTAYASTFYEAWTVSFYAGNGYDAGGKDSGGGIRLVRGRQ